jgi:glycosyltransferase involved in cell wall biosynthesis
LEAGILQPSSSNSTRSISMIVTTYNWKEALAVVLASVTRQTRLPDEVIIADDGSRGDTAEMLAQIAHTFPVRLLHSWQEDSGFRVARSRNRAIAASAGDYLLLVDGDMVLHPDFVADHMTASAEGSFVQGSRVLTTAAFRDRMLSSPDTRPTFFSSGISKRRNAIRMGMLSRAFIALNPKAEPHAIKTCNQGWWRSDLIRTNGFDERMEGWGREDVELAWRAHHSGISCRQLRYSGLAFHLHHQERHEDGNSSNDAYLDETKMKRSQRCIKGIDQHMTELLANPLPDLRVRPDPHAAMRGNRKLIDA